MFSKKKRKKAIRKWKNNILNREYVKLKYVTVEM